MGIELYSKLGSYLRIKVLKRLHAVRAAHSATHSQKSSVEANTGCSLAKVLTKHCMPFFGSFEVASRLGFFARLDLHGMDVPLIGYELTMIPAAQAGRSKPCQGDTSSNRLQGLHGQAYVRSAFKGNFRATKRSKKRLELQGQWV